MGWNKCLIISLLVSLTCVIEIYGQGCTMIDKCSCSMDDGSGDIKLDSVGRNDGTAAFVDQQAGDFLYSYNPCYAFTDGDCPNAAACQKSSDGSQQYLIGDADSAQFTYDGINVHLGYTGADGRVTDVTLVCDPNTDATLSTNGEISPLLYTFTLTTKCACPGQCGGGQPTPTPDPGPGPGPDSGDSSGDISVGTILCIAALAILVTYLISGAVFQKVKRQASGKEVIPNVSFWAAVPGLIKDGFKFTFGICRRGSYRSI